MNRDFSEIVLFDIDDVDSGKIICYGEEWYPLYEFPSYYISKNGSVLSFHRRKTPVVMKTWTNQHGHEYVGLRNHAGVKEKRLIHRLMAQTFVPNPKNLPQVRHLDDEPGNNDVENLAWGTALDNRMDAIRNNHDFRKPVKCIETGEIFRTCADAAKHFGVSRSGVTLCCQGKIHTIKGIRLCYC